MELPKELNKMILATMNDILEDVDKFHRNLEKVHKDPPSRVCVDSLSKSRLLTLK